MDYLESIHYAPLSSQGNVYTYAVLHLANDTKKLLVASLRREVICLDYQENISGILIPTTKEITFTYLPNGAEIISIAAFNKSETKNDVVIGITIIKNSNDLNVLETFLNIYSGWEESTEFNMESISQNCVNNIELKFTPYQLMYTYIMSWNEDGTAIKEIVFLLSGSDNMVHMFQESDTHTYKEVDCQDHFPEFSNLSEIITWMNIYYYKQFTERITAFGSECGYVRLCRISVKTNTILFNVSTQFENTISLVHIYPSICEVQRPSFLKADCFIDQVPPKDPDLNLIVVGATLPAVFFSDILTFGLRKYGSLPRFECVKIQSCVESADIDFDGTEEIIVGKHDKLVVYKFDSTNGWCIVDKRKQFPAAVLGLKYIDMTGDGVKELIVVTKQGIHVLQHNHEYVQKAIEEKLNNLDIPDIRSIQLKDFDK